MLSLSLRCVSRSNTKTRAFLFPPPLINSSSSSASASPPASFFFYSTTLAQPNAETSQANHLTLTAKDIIKSFKDWFHFGARHTKLLDKIFEILRAPRNEEDGQAADFALSELGLPLSEQLVLRVLAHGKDDVLSCLKFFDWAARQPRFHHTRATLYAIFKILRRARLMSVLVDFLDNNMKVRSFGHAVRLCDTLVMGYAVAGRPEIALQLLGKMRFRGLDLDTLGYHVLFNALVEQSCFDAADAISKQIFARGFECGVTHAILVKNFCKQKKVTEAEQHFRGLLSKEHAGGVDGYSLSILVDALCKNYMYEHAGRLLEECRELGMLRMEHAYGVWVKALVRAGNLDGALQFLHTKKFIEGYVPEVFRYNVLVFRLLRENRLVEVYDILIEMKEYGISPNRGTMDAVLCFFCKSGMVDVALELYYARSKLGITPNSMAYNYLINTLCGDGSIDEAYLVLKNSMDGGHFPGRKTFSILANALCREGKLDKMKELVLVALERNYMPTDTTYEKFISALCKAGRVEDGYLIHEELNRINMGTSRNIYVDLISGFNKSNRGDISARLLIEMQGKGYTPTRRLYIAVIRCLCDMENPESHFFNLIEMQLSRLERNCGAYNFLIEGAGYARKPELAREVFEMMSRDGIEPNLSSEILMLQSYIKSEKISDALNFFDGVRDRREIKRKLYNTMVVGLCKVNKTDIAMYFFQEMKEKGVVPSCECYEVLIQNMCNGRRYETAVNIVHDFKKTGRPFTSFIGNVLLYNALKTRALYEAWIGLRDVEDETPDMSFLGKLIGVFSGCISMTEPMEKLEEVIEKCFPLNIYTYNLLLRRLSMGQVDDAFEMFDGICRRGYEPNRWSYNILAHGLFKSGRAEEAKKLLEVMFRKGLDMTSGSKRFV